MGDMDHKKIDYPKTIVLDCDGVLTDGKFWISHKGEISKGFCTRDLRAIRELISHGFEVFIVTASSWNGMDCYEKKSGASVIVMRDKTQLNFGEDYIGVGDDSWDLDMLQKAKYKFCPSDAVESVKSIEGMKILQTKGGDSCVMELLIELVYNNL